MTIKLEKVIHLAYILHVFFKQKIARVFPVVHLSSSSIMFEPADPFSLWIYSLYIIDIFKNQVNVCNNSKTNTAVNISFLYPKIFPYLIG